MLVDGSGMGGDTLGECCFDIIMDSISVTLSLRGRGFCYLGSKLGLKLKHVGFELDREYWQLWIQYGPPTIGLNWASWLSNFK